MKKRNVHMFWVAIFLFALPIYGQEADKELAIRISDLRTVYREDSLYIHFRIRTQGIDLRTDQRLLLEFSLNSADRKAVLPTVLYSGKLRARYDRRYRLLSVHHAMHTPSYQFIGVDKRHIYDFDYKASLPYGKWMNQAVFSLKQIFETNGRVEVNEQRLSSEGGWKIEKGK
ncbi:hypothetical protein D0T51_08165 [Parabacteroides sp. 52]|uniref:hypothetical protein n=1 Tax=unclassified Parabacteroides TaxID=2649774 RepID=UPI0013D6A5A8|nr:MULTISPECIES: hypothetical protein [unclassified Parabacteroides]MDH6534922.1 hypothetical protein [Parabacteroides sp. PM5-20]NDV55699.1 hypothetical protein [Parabacteroides sp. 52]